MTAHNPATPGEDLTLFATGMGSTDPSVPAGGVSPAGTAPLTANTTTVVTFVGPIGGVVAQPSYAGLAPDTVGIYQVNFRLPTAGPPGVSGLYLEIGTFQTPIVPLYVRAKHQQPGVPDKPLPKLPSRTR